MPWLPRQLLWYDYDYSKLRSKYPRLNYWLSCWYLHWRPSLPSTDRSGDPISNPLSPLSRLSPAPAFFSFLALAQRQLAVPPEPM